MPIGGPVHAKGVEFEATGQLARGVTIGGNLSYHHTSYSSVDPRILASLGTGNTQYLPGTLSPAWEGSVYGELRSKPFANGASIMARIDGNWHDKYLLQANPDTIAAVLQPYNYAPAAWIVNGRVALQDITIGGVTGEIAVWGKNLTQNRDMTYALSLAGALAANYQQARTLGVDLKIHY